jgi:hypothetical protein
LAHAKEEEKFYKMRTDIKVLETKQENIEKIFK